MTTGVINDPEAKVVVEKELSRLLDEMEEELEGLDFSKDKVFDDTPVGKKHHKVVIKKKGKKIKVKIKSKLLEEPKMKVKIKVKKKKVKPHSNTCPVDTSSKGIVTLKQLASEFNVEGKVIRKLLRKRYTRVNGRWEWEASDPILKEIKTELRKKV